MQDKMKGVLYGAVAASSYGMNPLFALPLYSHGVGVNSTLFYRYVIAVVFLFLWIKIKKHSFYITIRQCWKLFWLGILFSLSSLFLFMSYNYMDAGVASTILFIKQVTFSKYARRLQRLLLVRGIDQCPYRPLCHRQGILFYQLIHPKVRNLYLQCIIPLY